MELNGKILAQQSIDGHNIRGMAFPSDETLIVTHQILHADAPTTANNIAAAMVIENVTYRFAWTETEDRRIALESTGIREIGVPSHGAADPAGIITLDSGESWVCLAGVDEVARLSLSGETQERLSVGDQPVALVHSIQTGKIVVLNRLSDSLTFIDPELRSISKELSLGETPPLGPQERGERLFFEGQVSRFGWMSCQSCHPHGHSPDLLADTFADDSAGAPKRILSLLGGRDSNPWGWNGAFRSLHDQVQKSSVTTMRGPGFSPRETMDVVSYLHTLPFPPPFRPVVAEADEEVVRRGKDIFESQGCVRCHVPPLTLTSDTVYDVGLTDENGLRKFNPPSLRGVGYRRRLFHDGRAQSLLAVFEEFGHGLTNALTDADQTALIRYLQSL